MCHKSHQTKQFTDNHYLHHETDNKSSSSQIRLIQELMLSKFKLSPNVTEVTKIIWCMEG